MILSVVTLSLAGCTSHVEAQSEASVSRPLTIIAIGDAGETGRPLRNCAYYINDMYTGLHDGGRFDAMIFLGDNFYPIGLNVPFNKVDGVVEDILGKFKATLEGLGRQNIHALAGNHDWYSKNAFETSLLFGLIEISEGPIGLSDRGNRRARELSQWTYYHSAPGEAFYSVAPGSLDSLQLLFFDSAVLLRTDPSTWRRALDSLHTLLARAKDRRGVAWRVLSVHHPFYSVGEHGEYSEWDDETRTVIRLPRCDKDSNAVGWLQNWLDPEDLCAEKYRQYIDSVKAVIHQSGAKVQFLLAGHDHSMQLLYYPDKADCDGCPKVHIVSGAGSKPARVKFPSPPYEYTSAQTLTEKEGESYPGFAQFQFHADRVRVVFWNASAGEPLDMGGGKTEFWIDAEGKLMN